MKKTILTLVLATILFTSFSQQNEGLTVKGFVKSSISNKALSAVTIRIDGYNATTTNDSGFFQLKLPREDAVLNVASPGYQSVAYPVKGRKDITILLYEEGYKSLHNLETNVLSTQNAIYSTKSTDYINFKSNASTPIDGVDNFIQGKIAGVNIINRTGNFGTGANTFIRGYNSINTTSQPLYVVDGIIFDNQPATTIISGFVSNPLEMIDPKDVKRITVVKDAMSIYGMKGANGVVFIETNRCIDPSIKIDLLASNGWNIVQPQDNMMNASDYRTYLYEQFTSSLGSGEGIKRINYFNSLSNKNSSTYYQFNNTTNWNKEIYNKTSQSLNQEVFFKVTGGDNIAKYYLTAGFLNNQGLLKNANNSKYSLRFNSEGWLTKNISFFSSMGFTYSEKNLIAASQIDKQSATFIANAKSPFFNPTLSDINGAASSILTNVDSLGVSNPLALTQNSTNNHLSQRFFGNLKFTVDLTKKFTFSPLIAVTYFKTHESTFTPTYGMAPMYMPISKDSYVQTNTVGKNIDKLFSIYNENTFSFKDRIMDNHYVNILVGTRYKYNENSSDRVIGYSTSSDFDVTLPYTKFAKRTWGGNVEYYKWLSFYGTINYNILKKYIFDLNISYDGSSRIGDEAKGLSMFSKKFATFPSVGAAWIVSSEPFMRNIDFVSTLKYRVSYGLTGNDEIGAIRSKYYYEPRLFQQFPYLVRGNIPNTELQWEISKKLNNGIDFGFFNERVFISVDYFNTTSEKLLTFNPNYSFGFSYWNNSAVIKSSGIEVGMNSRIVDYENFKWNFGFTISKSKNIIDKLNFNEDVMDNLDYSIITKVNEQVGTFFGFKTKGVFATQAEADAANLTTIVEKDKSTQKFKAGDIHFVDKDNNGKIDNNDRYVLGSSTPSYYGGFYNEFTYRKITLSANFNYSVGNKIYNYVRRSLESMAGENEKRSFLGQPDNYYPFIYNQDKTVVNRWKEEGQETDMPIATFGDPMGNSRFSDRWIEDGSFLRLKTITLSYDFTKVKYFRDVTMYVSGTNLLTITKYKGTDPEVSANTSQLMQGVDVGYLPQFASFYVGVRLGL